MQVVSRIKYYKNISTPRHHTWLPYYRSTAFPTQIFRELLLIQDAAYQSLLRSTRQQHHQRIAQVLEAQFPDLCATQPELLAQHYTEAGLSAQAIPYWQRAGQRAGQRSAHAEAIAHLSKGLELLQSLPDTPERARQELGLQVALGPALMVAKGWGAPEVEHVYARARALSQQVGESPELFPVLWGLWRFYLVRAEYQTARELGEQCLSLAQRVQDSALLLLAHLALGGTMYLMGELPPARAQLEQGLAFYNPQEHRALAFHYGLDLGVWCLSYVAWPLALLGYPDQALTRIHEALTLAQELAHPISLAAALYYAALLHYVRREGPAAQECAEAAIALSHEQGFPAVLGAGNECTRVGAVHTGTRGRGDGADAPGPRRPAGHGSQIVVAGVSCLARRGV
jgi:tetratricopeptide (TPR) repeat protein